MVAAFKQVVTVAFFNDLLNMPVKKAASWWAHAFRAQPGTPSGPVAFLMSKSAEQAVEISTMDYEYVLDSMEKEESHGTDISTLLFSCKGTIVSKTWRCRISQ